MDTVRHRVSKRLVLGRLSTPVDFSGLFEAVARPFAQGAASE